ncbi:MAG: MFS transporter [Sphingobacteriales bacterium]|jgi:UMF1 family MFS transporter|nr:MFS transporter [Sphingobacteriales bacterium]NCT75791.1 MFS transporter [Chitinophagaceae bacterium]OJW32679.1 MAG: MFS transporter [Sphingobacteriales bacterium 46-32]
MQTASKKVVNAWAMYDWANSAYNLVITSTIFPAYYVGITAASDPSKPSYVNFFGRQFVNTALQNYVLAFVFFLVAISSPILSSIADYRRNKKVWLRWFCYVGSSACVALFWFTKDNIEYGMIAFAIAAMGFWSSLVFYNSYLPDIAAPADQDRISAKGFAMGYIGSVLLQIICFVVILKPELFGLNKEDGTIGARVSFLLTGLWWFGFAQVTLRAMPLSSKAERQSKKNVLINGFHELGIVWRQLSHMPSLKRFLFSFFLYSMGVQTVMLVAAGFAKKEIFPNPDDEPKLLITIILIQLVAIPGAIGMSRLSKRIGNWWVITLAVLIWIGVCIAGYHVQTQTQFYILASIVGLVMGGIQSMSRSTYSKLLPQTQDTTSFFSFYDVTEKIAIVIGIFTFAYLEELTGNMRNSIVALGIFFICALLALLYAYKPLTGRLRELKD